MSDTGDTHLDLFLFSVCGIHFGVDAEQVSEVNAYLGEPCEDLFWFHEELGFGDEAITYLSPTIATIRAEGGQSYRVIIDVMEDIAEIGLYEILPFPPLIEPFALRKGMWGIMVRNNRLILLVDFKLLLREQSHVEDL